MPSTLLRARVLIWRAGVVCAAAIGAWTLARGLAAQSGNPANPIDQLIAQMTIEEKISMLHGSTDPAPLGQAGYVAGVPRLGIPPLRIAEGPAGIRTSQPATALPAPVSLASTFSPDLARTYGQLIARDGRARRQHVVLAPMVNIVRVPQAGRNFETFGEDPLLTSRMVAGEVEGIQRFGLIATVKHFAPDADERTLREIELPGFESAIRAGAAAVMAAPNTVNTDILRNEWKFDGFVMSDWGATQSAVPALTAGVDMEMPRGQHYASLAGAVRGGQISEAVVNRAVRRILIAMNSVGLLNPASANRPAPAIPEVTPTARELAVAGAVLLKNRGNVLPLGKEDTIALIGPGAKVLFASGGGRGRVQPMHTGRPDDALRKWAPLMTVHYAAGYEAAGADAPSAASSSALIDEAVRTAKSARTAVVFAYDESPEGRDRASLSLPGTQDALIQAVAAANSRTVVVLNNGAPILMPWAGQVAAILQMWYPGQEGADATAALLLGDASPGGKLPVTFPRRAEDAPAALGIFVGYRWYDQQKIEPLFPFGHGLTYSEFEYSGLAATPAGDGFDVTFTARNKGLRDATDVPQLYLGPPSPAPVPMAVRALVGFQRIQLQPGRTQPVKIHIGARELSYWSSTSHGWIIAPGQRLLQLGVSSRDIKQELKITVSAK